MPWTVPHSVFRVSELLPGHGVCGLGVQLGSGVCGLGFRALDFRFVV